MVLVWSLARAHTARQAPRVWGLAGHEGIPLARTPHRTRWLSLALAVVFALSLAPTTQAVPAGPLPAAPAVTSPARPLVIEPADRTRTPEVTLHLEPSTRSEGALVLISNDDGRTSVVLPFAPAIPWSLIDPAAGGIDEDGMKTVMVAHGDGTVWDGYARASIYLDRVAPAAAEVAGVTIDGTRWSGTVHGPGGAPVDDIEANRYSLDGGTTWQPWTSGSDVDIWNAPGAAAWAIGDLAIVVQLRDRTGNVSDPIATTAVLSDPQFRYFEFEGTLPGVTFEAPEPAITGKPFTIRVHYPTGYKLPANTWCQWVLRWGDDASIRSTPNPTWGELFIERPKANGACEAWTFTIPYRAARQFMWRLEVGTKGPNAHPGDLGTGIVSAGDFVFRALDGPHDERFASSSIPFAYVLPETTVSQSGDPVTYRLHTVGTSTVPQSGTWWTYPVNCVINPMWSQQGGSTYTFRPKCNGPWVTGWTGTMAGGYMRSQYDPLVDGRAPTVTTPVARIGTGGLGATVRGTVAWSGRDRGSGMRGYQVQARRDGGRWHAVRLPSSLTTSLTRAFTPGSAFQYRVRAIDRVGNWSPWVVSAPIRTVVRQESHPAVLRAGAWSQVSGSGLYGGTAQATTTAGASARITASSKGIGWVTRRGPGRGVAQVYVDGALVATIDLERPAVTGPIVAYARSWTKPGTHTMKVVAQGTLGRPLVEVDGFVVAS